MNDQSGDLLGRDQLRERHTPKPGFDVARNTPDHGGVRKTRSHDIHPDAASRQFESERSHRSMNARLRGNVGDPALSRADCHRRSSRDQRPAVSDVTQCPDQRSYRAGEVDLQDSIPFLPVQGLHGGWRRQDGGVREHAMERPKPRHERIDRDNKSSPVCDVSDAPCDLTTVYSDRPNRRVESLIIGIDSGDGRAFGCREQAVDRPMPLPAPVISTTRESRRRATWSRLPSSDKPVPAGHPLRRS